MVLEQSRPWNRVADLAETLGIQWHPSEEFYETGSGIVAVSVDASTREFVADFDLAPPASSLWRYLAVQPLQRPRLLIFPQVAESTAAALRRRDVAYLDLRGNAYLRFPGVHIRVSGARGRVDKQLQAESRRGDRPTNLFTPARARVVFALLQWPVLLTATTRELAQAAGVSTGIAHGVRSDLVDQGYLARVGVTTWAKRGKVEAIDILIDAWAAAFPTGLWRRLHHGDYASDLDSWVVGEADAAVGGEFALRSEIVPETVTVYVNELDADLRARHRIRRADARPNTAVCRRFWASPYEQEGAARPKDREVPWLLTYAEMLGRENQRLRDAAERMRGRARRGS